LGSDLAGHGTLVSFLQSLPSFVGASRGKVQLDLAAQAAIGEFETIVNDLSGILG
jgi:hypothetical protein